MSISLRLTDAPLWLGPGVETVVQAWDWVSQCGHLYLGLMVQVGVWITSASPSASFKGAPILKGDSALRFGPVAATQGRACAARCPRGAASPTEWSVYGEEGGVSARTEGNQCLCQACVSRGSRHCPLRGPPGPGPRPGLPDALTRPDPTCRLPGFPLP